jgi:hypothetical protein
MALVGKVEPQYTAWYEDIDNAGGIGGSVLAMIAEWGDVLVVAHKRKDGKWVMAAKNGGFRLIPTPSMWTNLPPAPNGHHSNGLIYR